MYQQRFFFAIHNDQNNHYSCVLSVAKVPDISENQTRLYHHLEAHTALQFHHPQTATIIFTQKNCFVFSRNTPLT